MALYRTCQYLLLFYVVYISWEDTDIKQLMMKNIGRLCPEADICGIQKQRVSAAGYTSCCAECSCEESCYITNNCCFPKDKGDFSTSQCISMLYPPPPADEIHRYIAYQIVTHPPEDGCLNNETNSPPFVAPWGDLYPVYSKIKNQIYLNQNVSNCHGVQDGKHFAVTLMCDKRAHIAEYDFAANLEALSTLNSSHCHVSFQYKGNKEDLTEQKCVINPIGTCDNSSMVASTRMPQEEIKRLCESGFFSPTVSRANYKNIFCLVCNENRSFQTCSIISGQKSLEQQTFTLLLKRDFLQTYSRQIRTQNDNSRNLQFCADSGGESVLLCPTTMVRSTEGTCIYPKVNLRKVDFVMTLKLTPNRPIPITDITKHRGSTFPSWIRLPWPKQWTVPLIFYETPIRNESSISKLFAKLVPKANGNLLESVVEKVTETMKLKWEMSLHNVTYTLEQSFAKFKNRIVKNGYFKILDYDDEFSVVVKEISYMLSLDGPSNPSIQINKMFYCNQVQLQEHEYILNDLDKILRLPNASRKVVFLDSEFSITALSGDRVSIRICLEDSDYKLCSSCGKMWHVYIVYFTLLCVTFIM